MGEIFRVNCPGCGEEKGPIAMHPGTVGIHCSCGISATVDISTQDAEGVYVEGFGHYAVRRPTMEKCSRSWFLTNITGSTADLLVKTW